MIFERDKVVFLMLAAVVVFLSSGPMRSQVRSQRSSEKIVQTTITQCNVEVPKKWQLANLNFSSLYLFEVSESGDVIQVKKVRDNFADDVAFKSCISKWRLIGFKDKSKFSAYFFWKHGKGWVSQEIHGIGFVQKMQLEADDVEKLIDQGNRKKP